MSVDNTLVSFAGMSYFKLYGISEGGSCGYCKDDSSPKYVWYTDAEHLSPQDYQVLIDRGWRRSGITCYKPINEKTCCPAYTIRCNATQFRLSRSHKRNLKRFAAFLNSGSKSGNINMKQDIRHPLAPSNLRTCTKPAAGDMCEPPLQLDKEFAHLYTADIVNINKPVADEAIKSGSGPHRSGSARKIRWERQQQRIQARSQREGVPFDNLLRAYLERRQKRLEKNKPKQLEDYFNLVLPRGQAQHFLEVRLCRTSPRSSDFNSSLQQTHKVYTSYQMSVHGDDEESVRMPKFLRFLVQSPLTSDDGASGDNDGEVPTLGSYHQQYWLDGEKLIAVGVIDLLPSCLSSVYFYYDPDYTFLQLGTYSALCEIGFIRRLNRKYGPDGTTPHPRFADFTYYYMGYYIHKCQKMQYKARFLPSDLACPETFRWVPVAECKKLLDLRSYSRFSSSSISPTQDSIDSLSESEICSRLKCLLPYSPDILKSLALRPPPGGWVWDSIHENCALVPLSIAMRVLNERTVNWAVRWARLVGRASLDGRMRIKFAG